MTLSDADAAKLAEELTGEVPEELQLKEDEDPWSITFDRRQPVRADFRENRVTLAIRGRRFTRGEQVVNQRMEASATYTIEVADGHVKLVRQGDIDVVYPDKEGDRLSLTELRNKTFMQNKFEGLFKPQFEGEGLPLPERLQQLKALTLAEASAENGWLTLVWRQQQ